MQEPHVTSTLKLYFLTGKSDISNMGPASWNSPLESTWFLGSPAQEVTVSLRFPKGSPLHFSTSQTAAQLLPVFVDTTSGPCVVTLHYTITPHQ